MSNKTKALVLSALAFGTAAVWAVKGCELLKIFKKISNDEFSGNLEKELQEGFDELEGQL